MDYCCLICGTLVLVVGGGFCCGVAIGIRDIMRAKRRNR